ncbi:MAG: hypothetical protein ACXWL5_02925 [Candidatus Chromulinivorax sp.]
MLTTKKITLVLFLTIHTCYIHAGITKTIIKGIIIPTTILNLGIRYYQADFDFQKFTRNLEIEKDAACTSMINSLEKNCDKENIACKEMIKCFKKAQSSQFKKIKNDIEKKMDEIKDSFSRK